MKNISPKGLDMKEKTVMHEEKLLDMIRKSTDPAAAAEVAISTILCCVKKLQPQEECCPIPFPGFDGKE